MASDRVKSLMQRLWMAENIAESEALLEAFERETQLNEAKRWCHNWYGYDNLGLSGQALETHRENCRDCQRVAALAAQPTPEVKK